MSQSPGQRRLTPSKSKDPSTHGLLFDHQRQEARLAGKGLGLTPKEFDVLVLLASMPGRVFWREEIASSLWKGGDRVQPHTIDVHVARLRKKLVAAGLPHAIKTVHGVGYRFLEG